MKINKKNIITGISLGLVLPTLTYFIVFYHSTDPPIFIWDEAIYATNALEMFFNNDFTVLQRHDGISLYNTKPPLVIWLQWLCMHLFGINELAVRLPSLIAGIFVVATVVYFSKKILGSTTIAFFAGLTLLCAYSYMHAHIVRSGDLDSLLTMFVTFYALLFIAYLIQENKDFNKYIPWLAISVVGGFYSKSVAGFMPLLGLGIAAILSDKRREIFSNKRLYLWIVGALIVCGFYYVYREYRAEGYLAKVFFSEYQRIYDNVMPWHTHPFDHYINILIEKRFYPFTYFLPLCILLGLLSKKKHIQAATKWLTIYALAYLLLISYPEVKVSWYLAPLYPIFAILIGILCHEVIYWGQQIGLPKPLLISILALCFIHPYYIVFQKNKNRISASDKQEYEGYFIRQLAKRQPSIKNFSALVYYKEDEKIDPTYFYMKSRNYHENTTIDVIHYLSEIQKDVILSCQKSKKDSIEQLYYFELLEENEKGCRLYELNGLK